MIPPVQPGDVVAGKYEVLRLMGQGAMGVVVAAHHLLLDKQVALKILQPRGPAADNEVIERFKREARAAARLRGENVAQVFDVGALDDGTPFIVMEYLEGRDLGAYLEEKGPLPAQEAVDLVLQACVAMAEAHAAGIIHRDLKPANLFLTRRIDGQPLVKVLDFGISKLFPASGVNELLAEHETQATQIMGSPRYMAPEQARSSRDVDQRADVWSLGVILYELLSGTLPHGETDSVLHLIAKLLSEPARPLGQVAPELPQGLCRAVDRCLLREPAERFQNMAELAVALLPHGSDSSRERVRSICALLDYTPKTPGESMLVRALDNLELSGAHDRPRNEAVADTAMALPVVHLDGASDSTGDTAGATNAEGAEASSETPARFGPPGDLQDKIELAFVPPVPAGLQRPATPERRQGAMHSDDAHRNWMRSRVFLYVIALGALGGLTVTLLVTGGKLGLLEPMSRALYHIGDALLGRVGPTIGLLAGAVAQIGVPLGLALACNFFDLRITTLVCVWWLGQNAVQISLYMTDAVAGEGAAQGVRAWGELFVRWDLTGSAATIAGITRWTGFAIMAAAVLILVERLVRRDPSVRL